jgi:hypothetical protein
MAAHIDKRVSRCPDHPPDAPPALGKIAASLADARCPTQVCRWSCSGRMNLPTQTLIEVPEGVWPQWKSCPLARSGTGPVVISRAATLANLPACPLDRLTKPL